MRSCAEQRRERLQVVLPEDKSASASDYFPVLSPNSSAETWEEA